MSSGLATFSSQGRGSSQFSGGGGGGGDDDGDDDGDDGGDDVEGMELLWPGEGSAGFASRDLRKAGLRALHRISITSQ